MSNGRIPQLVITMALLVALGPAGAAAADKPADKSKPETKRVEAVGHWAFSRLNRAHEALSEERYEDATRELDDMKRGLERLNPHERAMMWQTYGYVQASQGEHEQAVASFEKCLAENGLPENVHTSTIRNVAQIYLMLNDYEKAIEKFEQLIARTEIPTSQTHYMLALAYAQSGNVKEALAHAELAVEKTDQPDEGRLQLLAALYFREERFEDLLPLLEQLVTHFPKKSYWIQLSAIYVEVGRPKEALGVQEAAYEQDLLTEHREYLTLARLFLQNDVPYEAAQVIEGGIERGVVEPVADAWELLGSAYLQAREYEKAVGPLERAAEVSQGGEVYLRLGEVYLNRYRWADARRALASAIRKGGVEDVGLAHLLLGIANAGESRYEAAKTSLTIAGAYDKHAEVARQWIEHVERERQFLAAQSQTVSADAHAGDTGVDAGAL